jgi:hypothetical protein
MVPPNICGWVEKGYFPGMDLKLCWPFQLPHLTFDFLNQFHSIFGFLAGVSMENQIPGFPFGGGSEARF